MGQQADDERLQAFVDCGRKVPLAPALQIRVDLSAMGSPLSADASPEPGILQVLLDLDADAPVEASRRT